MTRFFLWDGFHPLGIQQAQLTCNTRRKGILVNDGGTLTNDAGMTLVGEFLKAIDVDVLLQKRLHLSDNRKFSAHSWFDVLKQWVLQLIAGYAQDRDANTL